MKKLVKRKIDLSDFMDNYDQIQVGIRRDPDYKKTPMKELRETYHRQDKSAVGVSSAWINGKLNNIGAGPRILTVHIDLKEPDMRISRQLMELIQFYRRKARISPRKTVRPPEINKWEVYDLVNHEGLEIPEIVKKYGHRFRILNSDNNTNIRKRLESAYNAAERTMELVEESILSWGEPVFCTGPSE